MVSLSRLGSEFEAPNDHLLARGRRFLEAPKIDAHRQRLLRNVCSRGRVAFCLDHFGSFPDRLCAAHQREYDSIRGPFHPGGGESSAADVEIVLPTRSTVMLAVSCRGIDREIGVASVAGFIPLREFNVDFIFSVDPHVMIRPVGEQAKHRGGIHLIDVALNYPLVSSEAEILGGEQFGGGPFSVAPRDVQMQIALAVDADVGWISLRDSGHSSVGDLPGVAGPADRLGVCPLREGEQSEADDDPGHECFGHDLHFRARSSSAVWEGSDFNIGDTLPADEIVETRYGATGSLRFLTAI